MVLKVVFLWEVNQPFHHKQRGNVSSQFWRINSLTDLSTRFVYLVRSKVDEKHFREPGNIFHLIQSGGRGTQLVGRTVKLTCSLVCTIYETRLNLIEDKNRVAQLFVGISLKRSLSPLFHINHSACLISTYMLINIHILLMFTILRNTSYDYSPRYWKLQTFFVSPSVYTT